MEVHNPAGNKLGISELLELGFERVGSWAIQDEGIRYELTSFADERHVLYAFVVNNKVKYIGKTIQPLKKRIYSYRKPGFSQKTNIRINGKIINELNETKRVDIFVLINHEPLFFHGIEIDLAAGIEDGLIDSFNPDWNIRKNTKTELGQYRRNKMTYADQVRQYVIENYIQPAREKGKTIVNIRAGDIHKEMHFNNRMPLICGALDAQKFYTLANIQLIDRSGPDQGSNAKWVLKIIR